MQSQFFARVGKISSFEEEIFKFEGKMSTFEGGCNHKVRNTLNGCKSTIIAYSILADCASVQNLSQFLVTMICVVSFPWAAYSTAAFILSLIER